MNSEIALLNGLVNRKVTTFYVYFKIPLALSVGFCVLSEIVSSFRGVS